MNDLVTDVKSLELETLKNLKSSKASNTLRAYKADFRDFALFCQQNGFNSMPSEPKIITLYLTHLSKSSKFSTLKRRLASISVLHKLNGHYLDTKHPIITENLLGIKRVKGTYQKSKKPILINDLKLIINAINQENNSKNKVKNKALVLIGFAGGFRRSELVSVLYEDVEFVSEGVKIFVKRSKTDQSGEGMTKGIPYFSRPDYCPVISLKNWIQEGKVNSGKIFDMSDKNVALTIKKYAAIAGLVMPSIGLRISLVIAIKAPVLPAETTASAFPDLTSCIAIPIEEFLPFRTAILGFSFESINSLV